jgi:hypothetical protein
MMRSINTLVAILIFITGVPLSAQVTYDELEFEADSITRPYKAKNRNYAFIRSKRGSSGVNRNNRADSAVGLTITDIVLVFTELDAQTRATRHEANRDRWENLIRTYPEYFDYNPTLVNMCQCNFDGDSAAFKKLQGFYVFFEGDDGAAAEPVQETVTTAPVRKMPEDRKQEAVKTEKQNEEPDAREERSTRKEKVKEPAPEPEVVAEPKKEKKKKEKKSEEKDPTDDITMDVPAEKPAARKKVTYTKPRKAKDPKACRPACYENGDQDLHDYFRDNITLTKKQRRKGKQLVASVRLQLNLDGSIKKAMVTGTNEVLNKQVQEAVNGMNQWNPTVKNGATIKSEVRITLKYDKETKGMKPSEVVVMPRLAAKCKCISDAELFGGD